MQGLYIQAAITWVINREGDGPMRAYKFLGDDLVSTTPK